MRLTATQGEIVCSRTFVVMEAEQIVVTTVSPRQVTLPLGDTQLFNVVAINQFGNTEIETTGYYEATALGDYQLVVSLGGFTDTAFIHVVDYADLNLALGKPTSCSGYENVGTKPENITDGLLDTRWSSRFQDGEWIAVDLGKVYWINRVKLYWEAAYATHYDIQVSIDGVLNIIQPIPTQTQMVKYKMLFCPIALCKHVMCVFSATNEIQAMVLRSMK